ncbi:MAG TPA: type II toxin-antitoxin system RelE/ParE family toxin [Bacteroidales bacterium]|nr:type II toxin-antitoxin system RelE/ParE family toxin [Bacteroidales bacterium]
MVKIVWTELSISDLREIFDYIAEDSIRYASITVNKIYQRVQLIIENSSIGSMVPEFSKKSIREIIDGNYRIIYLVRSKSQVDILRVYHVARSLKKKNLK